LNTAEFDQFADEYTAMQGKIVRLSGEPPGLDPCLSRLPPGAQYYVFAEG
jgi:hypothetical protein